MQKWEYAVITFFEWEIVYYRSNLFTEDQLKEINRNGTLKKNKKMDVYVLRS